MPPLLFQCRLLAVGSLTSQKKRKKEKKKKKLEIRN